MDFNENHYSVKQKIGDPGSKSIRNIFRSILSRQNGMNRHMEQHISFLAENPVFQFFGLEIYRTRVGQSDAGEGIGMGWESWREAPANSSCPESIKATINHSPSATIQLPQVTAPNGVQWGPKNSKNCRKTEKSFFHKNRFFYNFKWYLGGLGVSGGMAWTVRTDSLEVWRDLVLHGMGEVDFHV